MPTVPSTDMRVPTPTPAMPRRPRKMTEIDADAVHEDQLHGGRVVLRGDADGADLARHPHPLAPRGVGDRDAARDTRHRRGRRRRHRGSPARRWGLPPLALAGGAPGDDGRQRDAAPWSAASRWKGTDVTLAWGRRETCSRMASAVLSWSTRCQMPRYLRSGSSTDTSVSPSASSRTTHSTARAREAAVGAVDELERHTLQAGARPLLGELVGLDLVDDEVHGPHLVGRERAGVLDGAGRGHVEAVDEHQHDVAAQDRRGGGGGDVVLELLGLALVLPVEAEQHRPRGPA